MSRSQVSRAVAAGSLVRVRPRVYSAEALPAWPEVLVRDGRPVAEHVTLVQAALLSLGRGACAAGRTAAALHGWDLLVEPLRVVEVLVPHGAGRRRLPGAVIRQRRRLRPDVLPFPCGGVLVTAPVATVVDCCQQLGLLEAVVVLDSGLRSRAVTRASARRGARALRAGRDRARVLRVLQLCDPASGSVLETVLRVRLVLAGMSGFQTQVVVRDAAGRHVLRADFCFARAKLIVEVDGKRWHRDTARDRRVDNALAAAGWRVLRYTWADVVHDPERVLREIQAALCCDR